MKKKSHMKRGLESLDQVGGEGGRATQSPNTPEVYPVKALFFGGKYALFIWKYNSTKYTKQFLYWYDPNALSSAMHRYFNGDWRDLHLVRGALYA